MYGNGKTEELLGSVMKEEKEISNLKVATKANPWYGDLSRSGTRKQLEDSLSALRVNCVDVFYLHGPDSKNDIRDTLEEVQKMYKENKFSRFALSNFTPWETMYIYHYMEKRKWILPSASKNVKKYFSFFHSLSQQCLTKLSAFFPIVISNLPRNVQLNHAYCGI